jgi:hypothetical protein
MSHHTQSPIFRLSIRLFPISLQLSFILEKAFLTYLIEVQVQTLQYSKGVAVRKFLLERQQEPEQKVDAKYRLAPYSHHHLPQQQRNYCSLKNRGLQRDAARILSTVGAPPRYLLPVSVNGGDIVLFRKMSLTGNHCLSGKRGNENY